MTASTFDLVSVDDHLIEPPGLWTDRAPSKWRERVPRIVEAEGREFWEYDGVRSTNMAISAVAGKDPSEFGKDPARFADMRAGCYDIAERVRDMDLDGVTAQLCFPTYAGWVGRTFLEAEDKDLALWCLQAYNDFVLDEWCSYSPGRQIPCTIVPMWDAGLAAAEASRCITRGARAISFAENLHPLGLPSWHTDHWDPLFAVVQEADVPLTMHVGSSSKLNRPGPDAATAAWVVLTVNNAMSTATDLIFSRVFHTFPALKVALAEGGFGWVGPWLERCADTYERHRFWADMRGSVHPEELFAKHIWVCAISDRVGVELRERIGVEKMMWESDYPHADSNWPNSRRVVDSMFAGVSQSEVELMTAGNARRLFRWPANG